MYVTENGIATADDAQRVDYLRTHLAQVARALREGVDVRGFHYWSSFDNFEWAEGYRPMFGLIGDRPRGRDAPDRAPERPCVSGDRDAPDRCEDSIPVEEG